jgi:hypothetical protein
LFFKAVITSAICSLLVEDASGSVDSVSEAMIMGESKRDTAFVSPKSNSKTKPNKRNPNTFVEVAKFN